MAPSRIFDDGFACSSAHPCFAVHLQIEADLLQFRALRNTPATLAMLFPGTMGLDPAEQAQLIPVLVERIDWHCSHRETPDDCWMDGVRAMLRAYLRLAAPIDDPTLRTLVRWGSHLCRREAALDCYDLPRIVGEAVDALPVIEARLAEDLNAFTEHLTRQHYFPENFALGFRLYREGKCDVPWAAGLSGAAYDKLLQLADHHWQSGRLPEKTAAKIRLAVNQIGSDGVVRQIGDALSEMEARQPVMLNAAGLALLRQMLLWMQAVPELKPAGAIYRLCGIHWHPDTEKLDLVAVLFTTLLQTVTTLPDAQAFACVERLSQHPQMKCFHEVGKLYEQLLGVRSQPSVDGFAGGGDQHRILDNLLQASAHGGTLRSHVDVAFQQAASDYVAMLRAMNERVRWIAAREPKSSGAMRMAPYLNWCCDLGELYCRILARKPAVSAADLAELCRIDAMNWLGVGPTAPLLALCESWIGQHGFEPGLSEAMREWHKSIHGGATAMALRRDVGWLLWFDTTAPVNEKACWSAVIQKDLRSMTNERRGAWIALLRNVPLAPAAQPSKKWLKPAAKLLKDVGTEDFRERVRVWFEPFREAKPLKLTLPGRDMLAALFWYAHLAQDASTDEALLWYATAKWKTQADLGRTARLLPVWVHAVIERTPDRAIDAIHSYQATGQLALQDKTLEMYEEHCRRRGRKSEIAAPPLPAPLPAGAFMEKALNRAMTGLMGGMAGLSGDVISVQSPDGDQYEIGTRDGRITRLSDRKQVRLEIDWSAPPFAPFRQMIDAADLNGPFQPNYFRAMLCAQILSGSLPVQVPIVEEEL